ncbi:MAG: DinB family protein [Salibacteraceae bacterium]
MISRPEQNEYNNYYQLYIDQVDNDPIKELQVSSIEVVELYNSIPENKLNWAYAEGKWTIKDLLQHILDVERVMAYRALTFARYDKSIIPGFDHDKYAELVDTSNRDIYEMLDEYVALRNSTVCLLKSFSDNELSQVGNANGSDLSVRAIAYILCGHELHHIKVLSEKYLPNIELE